jgi:hypothetical protein
MYVNAWCSTSSCRGAGVWPAVWIPLPTMSLDGLLAPAPDGFGHADALNASDLCCMNGNSPKNFHSA